MSLVTFECAAPLCSAAFGVANPDPWDTDLALADEQHWVIGWGLAACCDEHLALGHVATLVTPSALALAARAADKAEQRKVCTLGYLVSYSLSREWPVESPRIVDLAQKAIADQYEAHALAREADTLAGAA